VFASFCAVASGIYLVKDLLRLAADRRRECKRHRPFASGELPPSLGIVLASSLVVTGIILALVVGIAYLLMIYIAVSLSYSLVFKQNLIFDVFFLAAVSTLRIIAGAVATQRPLTVWLLAFTSFAFLSLALVKCLRQRPYR
jgi:4-hydroxybenzoate polyprenyltransferase